MPQPTLYRRRPARWLTAAAMLACAMSLVLSGCGQGGGATARNGGTDPGGSDPGGGTTGGVADPGVPEIAFVQITHDFGDIYDTQTYKTQFAFSNTGTGKLVIDAVKAACGCTVPKLSGREYAPGESGTIDVTFDPKGKSSKTLKYITVASNAGETKLTLVSNIKPMLEYERMHRLGTIQYGAGYVGEMVVSYDDPELKIVDVSCNNPAVHGRVKTAGEPAQNGDKGAYRSVIEVTVDQDAPWGLIYATRLTIDVMGRPGADEDPTAYSYTVFVMGDVFGDLHAVPAILGLGQIPPGGDFEKSSIISSPRGTPFEITGVSVVESTMAGVQARFERDDDGTYSVYVFGNVGTHAGIIRGRIALTTNVAGEEHLELRFAGSIKK